MIFSCKLGLVDPPFSSPPSVCPFLLAHALRHLRATLYTQFGEVNCSSQLPTVPPWNQRVDSLQANRLSSHVDNGENEVNKRYRDLGAVYPLPLRASIQQKLKEGIYLNIQSLFIYLSVCSFFHVLIYAFIYLSFFKARACVSKVSLKVLILLFSPPGAEII